MMESDPSESSDEQNDSDIYENREYPIIGTAASEPLRETLLQFKHSTDLYAIGEATIKLQLSLWQESQKIPKVDLRKCEVFGIPLNQIQFEGQLGDHPEHDLEVIYKAVGADKTKLVYTWEKLPYTVRCVGRIAEKASLSNEEVATGRSRKRKKVSGEDQMISDVDEWVLRNEVFLRSLSRGATSHPSWKYGLVPISHFSIVFSNVDKLKKDEEDIALKIRRPTLESLLGYTLLHQKRTDAVYLQPTLASFKTTWEKITNNALKGLDWSNVFVAGGLVLGTLLCPPIPEDHAEYSKSNYPEQWLSSDIDLYIYGLGPNEANAKIAHIADVYRSNLPEDLRSSMLLVRNSQTITLYSEWPRRRVQIVLKLIGSPREVLLNFDLDICAVGYDGIDVWLLPRCARALETGLNIFTMDLINGHYLGDRKATRDQRVFKYADKGYGIRILQSYQATLATYTAQPQIVPLARGAELRPPPLDLVKIAADARQWTDEFMALALKHGHGKAKDKNGVNTYRDRGASGTRIASTIPVFSHAMLEPYTQNTSEPLGRSCLTGFELLMRHVALWEAEVGGRIRIVQNLFAVDTYGHECVQAKYDDTPKYDWDERFNMKDFKKAINDFNEAEILVADDNSSFLDRVSIREAARTTYANSVEDLLSPKHDIVIPLVLSLKLMKFANEIIKTALTGHGLTPTEPLRLYLDDDHKDTTQDETMVRWQLNSNLNWQMLDRRIDEVREILWAFHRANDRMYLVYESRVNFLRTHISRRAIRDNGEDEMEAFLRWVGRRPHHVEAMIHVVYALAEGLADWD